MASTQAISGITGRGAFYGQPSNGHATSSNSNSDPHPSADTKSGFDYVSYVREMPEILNTAHGEAEADQSRRTMFNNPSGFARLDAYLRAGMAESLSFRWAANL